MVKKIRMLGMDIDNFTLAEEIGQCEEFYHRQELNIIRTVSVGMLSMAAAGGQVREGIGQADLLIIEDKEILTQAGIYSAQRLKEAGENGFMRECLKRMCQEGRRVFLVAGSRAKLGQLEEFLKTAYETMYIVGCYVLGQGSSDYDTAMNEINAAMPDAVLSVLDSPIEDGFLLQAKPKVSAKVWYSLGGNYRCQKGKLSFLIWFRQLIHKGKLKNVIHQYEDGNEKF